MNNVDDAVVRMAFQQGLGHAAFCHGFFNAQFGAPGQYPQQRIDARGHSAEQIGGFFRLWAANNAALA